ncbi:leucine-rich repeat receptor-like tyrosine-protein kinase PXC3 isoform X2 [Arabidopsis lyrata subsp. lyrata]|uniref:leucine-rich repeat receptor-like tyrosine-protein kinase PXC3 isoform X2 n=1 Tax=Arabidopsis lyrata subsp. lyrata TaxID=81972 RepID=UPI000A29A81B|nr:leucine-rich repeat receptor-like tyrosine-protein kinase PXC3 isoform X2 [Arabidopsis lyrata subsp. lyrata]|eukprot:XP_020884033.1 leucine-rich repeat receptor-like tyrosine-protein kinase PXC3 isoform X2 [Arabidopsis lyrata subsp. lyrata]
MAFWCMSILLILVAFLSKSEFCEAQLSDEATLVAINRELGVPGWSSNGTDYCTWVGLKCGLNNSFVEMLDLSGLQLRGNVTLISDLRSLKHLDLSSNNFNGPIPASFGNLSELEFLDLSLNRFVGAIPVEFGKLRGLKAFNISNNLLVGEIPDELKVLERLEEFQVSGNGLNGSIPHWVGNLSNLRVFTAYENDLVGEIPNGLGSVSELELLNLHSNQLEGKIPKGVFEKGKLKVLVLTQNRLTGELPEAVGICSGLSSIRIGNNELVGVIPKTIGNISGLTYFEADNNNLSGNSLFGEIPKSFLGSGNLNKLDLSNNRLNGTIPKELCIMPRLQYLLLDQNSIRGDIPHEIGNCVKLLQLQLGRNYLTGTIPPEIGRMRNLQIALNLSFNHLHGSLPPELGKLDKLVSLDVSNNLLTGSIPQLLKGMMSLIEVNFSNNLLNGPVPVFVPFQKSPNSSFSGNKELCGAPLSSSCGNSEDLEHLRYNHRVSYRIVLAVIGSGVAVFVSVTVVVLLFMMREKQEKAAAKNVDVEENVEDEQPAIIAGNVFLENLKQGIDLDAVVKATMKESNKLSTGTFSSVYKAVMPSGMIVSVKKLKSMDRAITHHQNKMIRELERLSKLCHDHLVRPIGFVIYEDVALLLHQHLPNGNLTQLIHESTKKPEYQPDWPMRLSIAVGVAEGLAFLHQVAIIHLDVSSSNVLIDSGYKAVLGEIEISKLLDPSRGTASISSVAGSFGYIPPEYAYTMQVTAPGNVYSYGVVLLEILTSRAPVEEEFGEGVDLVKWVHGASARGETPEQILDAKLSTVSFAWRREMLAALKVALLCTDITPAKRPKMKKVVEMLQEVKQIK